MEQTLNFLSEGKITFGHARALLGLKDKELNNILPAKIEINTKIKSTEVSYFLNEELF